MIGGSGKAQDVVENKVVLNYFGEQLRIPKYLVYGGVREVQELMKRISIDELRVIC
jgi:hypothetical protein